MKKAPLIERTLDKNLIGLSYTDFLKQRKLSKLAQSARVRFGMDKVEIEFEDKLQYLTQTVSDLTLKKTEVKELWDLSFKISENETDISSILNTTFYPLVSLTGEASLSYEEKDEIMTSLDNFIKEKFKFKFEHENAFENNVNELFYWYEQKIIFLKHLEIGLSYAELSYLKGIYNHHLSKFELLKSNSYDTYIKFIRIVKYAYKGIDNRYKFIEFYNDMCLQHIIVAKNSGNYYKYKEVLEDYYTATLPKRTNWLYKNVTGYGEEPFRLVVLFLILNILFALIFSFSSFNFHFEDNISNCWFEKFITYITFNITSMMTVGYGDIYPIGIGARLVVALMQITGFAVSGAAIALYLKKLFRF